MGIKISYILVSKREKNGREEEKERRREEGEEEEKKRRRKIKLRYGTSKLEYGTLDCCMETHLDYKFYEIWHGYLGLYDD